MDDIGLRSAISEAWRDSALPSLAKLVEIPALSMSFDAEWERKGFLEAAARHVQHWVRTRSIPGVSADIITLPGRSPVLLIEIPGTSRVARKPVLIYGHLDRQPPLGEWSPGLGPWRPVIRDDKLYGRGAADDGYAGYAAVVAHEAVRAAGGGHAPAYVLLETGEESGSPDMAAYLDHLGRRLGEVGLVICLDAGGGDYERLWVTSSLRGLARLTVTVRVLNQPQHSGMAGGVVPSPFRIMRQLLDRIEDAETGRIRLEECNGEIPAPRRREAAENAAAVQGFTARGIPVIDGLRLLEDDPAEQALSNTWRPTLAVIGADGMPSPLSAGNVLLPSTTLVLSLRLPPTADARRALSAVSSALTTDVPYNARVEVTDASAQDGWDAPAVAPWLEKALAVADNRVFGAARRALGLGASVPFVTLLARRYPAAQFLVTGALGADSNAHAVDERLDLPFTRKVTSAVGYVLDGYVGS